MSNELRNVIINAVRLSDEQVRALEQMYRVPIQDGAYWYDRISGAWGVQGGPVAGVIRAGLNLGGPLREDASNGNTGVFINGRNLHIYDVLALQRFMPVYPGRYWADAQGNFGYIGGQILGNFSLLSEAAGGASGGPWSARST